jgi:hypothetical protein
VRNTGLKYTHPSRNTSQLRGYYVLLFPVSCSNKALHFVQPRSEKFGIATKSTVFCAATQRKILELRRNFVEPRSENFGLRTKALYFVQPHGEKICNCEQKLSIWFSRTEEILEGEKSFGFATKSTVHCSTTQRKRLESRTKALHFVQVAHRNILKSTFSCWTKRTVFCSAAQRNFLELRRKTLYFVQPRSEIFLEVRTKALYLFSSAAKILEL